MQRAALLASGGWLDRIAAATLAPSLLVLTVAEKLLEGPRLFHRAWQLMADGIRHVHPELDESGVQRLLVARLSRLADLERR